MKSRITIEVDFDNANRPVLQILQQHSDDVRDRLLSHFLQSLQHTSRWCIIEYKGNVSGFAQPQDLVENGVHRWHIRPMTPGEIPAEIKLMNAV